MMASPTPFSHKLTLNNFDWICKHSYEQPEIKSEILCSNNERFLFVLYPIGTKPENKNEVLFSLKSSTPKLYINANISVVHENETIFSKGYFSFKKN